MDEKRIIDCGDLKSRIENTLSNFYWVNKIDINAKNDPFSAVVYIDPKLIPYNNVIELISFLGDNEEKAVCKISETGAVLPLRDGFKTEKEIEYLLGMNEIKTLLEKSYALPDNQFIDSILKVHEDVHIFIKDKKPLSV